MTTRFDPSLADAETTRQRNLLRHLGERTASAIGSGEIHGSTRGLGLLNDLLAAARALTATDPPRPDPETNPAACDNCPALFQADAFAADIGHLLAEIDTLRQQLTTGRA